MDASDLGAGPAGSFRLSAGQLNLFKLDFTWRTVDYFSALPAFANPFIDEGIVPGQQTYNRTRQIYDVNVQILPGKKLTPILGYTQNIYRGPGTTTYHLGSDEFLLNQNINSKDEEFRVGLGFDFGMVQGAIVQGWRKYRSADTVSLAPGAGGGNVSVPVLGQDEHADGIVRTTSNSTDTPVTSIWVTAKPISRLRLVGSYVRSDADGDTGSAETDAGTFVSFEISRFFQGLTDTISSHAETDYWRGSARAEFSILSNVTLSAGWTERSRDSDRKRPGDQPLHRHDDVRRREHRRHPADRALEHLSRAGRPRVRRHRDGHAARAGLRQRGLVAAPPGRDVRLRSLERRDPRRGSGELHADGEHLRRRRVVRQGGLHARRRLPPRRRESADHADRLHEPGPLQGPGRIHRSRTS